MANLSSTTLPPEDYALLVDNIANGGLKKLVEMNLEGVILCGVEANDLGQAIVKKVDLSGTHLTVQQCQRLMNNIVTVCPKLEVRVETLQYMSRSI